MNSTDFVQVLKQVVTDSATVDVEENLIDPPGRQPSRKLIEMSNWYNKLNDQDKIIVRMIINESVNTAVFGFLCVIDGVRAIEDDEEKGKLELYYKKDEISYRLNDPNNFLHDIYNAD